MAKPEFTKDEQALIAYIKLHDRSSIDALIAWLPWLVISGGFFAYGFMKDVPGCALAGFVIAFYLLGRLVYYQTRPSWRMKPIIDKFEKACEESHDR